MRYCLAIILLLSASAWGQNLSTEWIEADTDALADVQRMSGWQTEPGSVSLGYAEQSIWLRYQIPEGKVQRAFVIDNPWLFNFDLFVLNRDGSQVKFAMGGGLPTSNRPLIAPVFAVPIGTNVAEVYIHDKGESATSYPVRLMPIGAYSKYQALLNNFHGFYYGLVLIMVLYNLALFFGTRDSAYAYYSLYAAALSTFLISADGTGSLMLWPETPTFQYLSTSIGWGIGLILLIEFAKHFMRINKQQSRGLRIAQGIVLAVSLYTFFFVSKSAFAIQTVVTAGVLSYVILLAALIARAGRKEGRLFLIGNSFFVLGSLAHVALLFGWMPHNVITHHLIHVGSVLELAFFSIVLALRVRESQAARLAAVRRSQELSRHNRELQIARSLAEEHRLLQRSVHQAQKQSTIGQLAGGFAHDFNNILASMMGFAELAQKQEAQADKKALARYLDEIVSSGERGAALVKQLLIYSRNSPQEAQRIDLAATVSDIIPLLTGSLPATVQIDAHLASSAIWVQSDAEYIQQLLVNLSLNAAEAGNNRSQVSIHLDVEDLDQMTCTSCLQRWSGQYAVIKVEDNGPGISGNANDLFTPFHTSKDVGQGTGLGLSVVHGITHDHSGHVVASNRVEGGARFAIYLPLDAEPEQTTPQTHKRILIIEDDASVAEYLELLLQDADYATTLTKLPTQALELFVANPDNYDLVITDHLMPYTTGIELAQDIHAVRPEIPVLMVTGNADLPDSELAEVGIRGIFQKPLNSEQLLAKIQAVLVGT